MKVIERPNLQLYEGVKITKDLVLNFENETRKQEVKDLVLTTIDNKKGEGYDTYQETHVYLEEGKYLILDENIGYIYPLNQACTLEEAIEEIKELNDSIDKEA